MKKKQFKAESKKLLDMMIHSIYTNKEIFLRELISNASDALDKLSYQGLTDKNIKVNKNSLEIRLIPNKEDRTLTIVDNGIGMTKEELEENLGTIARSGSELFKENMDDKKNMSIIGQFGVGFYSAFMVSDQVTVCSKSVHSTQAYTWTSTGADGYTLEESEKEENGTTITLYLKDNSEEENYDEFLEEGRLSALIKKYSDYIHYPIRMTINTKEEEKEVQEDKTLNSMIPIWHKKKKDVKEEDYNDFYTDKFYDYEKPLHVIQSDVEGRSSYKALLFIPSHAPFDYYSKNYEKGLQLYSRGVLIMDKCSELLPDHFSFVKGIVDSEDISLNISRETLQDNSQIRMIAKSLETKIRKELETILKDNRDNYEKFYNDFGMQLKYGIYSNFGMNKEELQDLLLFYSSKDKKYTTLKEYTERMIEGQDKIYYASGESLDKIDLLPQVERIKEKYEILYLTNYMDEFVLKTMMNYNSHEFLNISDEKVDLDNEEERESLKKANEEAKDMFSTMKEALDNQVEAINFTHKLKNHPICLTSKGEVSVEMEKALKEMPNGENIKAQTIMEINEQHPIANKLKNFYKNNKTEELKQYSKILYAQARLIEGLSIENPTEISNLICNILTK